MNRERRRAIRKIIEAETGSIPTFWVLDIELADGTLLNLHGDAIDRELTIRARIELASRFEAHYTAEADRINARFKEGF